MRALVIRQPWIDLLLSGRKSWEMRSKATNVRGSIALIRAGSGLVVGVAHLMDSLPALTRVDYMNHGDQHAIPTGMLDKVLTKRWVYPWVLENIQPLQRPVPYPHPSGAVTFVNLSESVSDEITRGLTKPHAKERVHSSLPGASTERPAYTTAHPATPSKRESIVTARLFHAPPIFEYRPETAQAWGHPLPDGQFVVHANSTAMKRGTATVKRDARDRDQLIGEGVLVADASGDHYRFTRDHPFSSASKAAGIVKDGNASGPGLWIERGSGRSLKEYLTDAQASEATGSR